ncbi:Gldg family protein [Chitinophaga sp. Hz27]|uniref:Gldg family protein n=1 Tax=Chitinophaga sp. Hz27 TaxID=3347169 RepID=UPI0035D5FE2F
MKTIIKIAKTELRTLFYSPIVWFLMIAFLVQSALAYMGLLERYLNYQEAGGLSASYIADLTNRIFLSQDGFFNSVMDKLYLYIPLLTMGLISRETSSGTMRLLYSSPVKVWQIVLGKYAATMVYSLIMVSIAAIFMVAGAYNIQSVDVGLLLSATLGFYLLLCTYAAIGLFMSCLSIYQVVAAISTFVMIAALSYVGTLWQNINFVRDLTYFLALSGRAHTLLGGLISTSTILYFVLVTAMFLAFTYLKLKGGMESKPPIVKGARYVIVFVLVLVIGYISSRPRFIGYYDATARKTNTLRPRLQEITKAFNDGPLDITVYNNLLNRNCYIGLPQARNGFMGKWGTYLRFKTDINFNFVNYYDSTYDDSRDDLKYYKGKTLKEIAQQKAKAQNVDFEIFKSPDEIRKMIDLKPELSRFVMQLRYKNKTTFLRVFNDMEFFPGESEIAAAFKRLQQSKFPKIAFLTGELERSIHNAADREYKKLSNEPTFRHALINQGFDVDTVNAQTSDIPTDITALVVADPKAAFPDTVLAKLRKYIENGGNILIAGEPGKQAVLNPLLQTLGVQLMDGILVQPGKDKAPDLALTYLTSTSAAFTQEVDKAHKDSLPVSMPGATGLTWDSNSGFTVKPLLISDDTQSWIKKDKLVTDSGQIVFSAANGDDRKAVPLALSLSRKVHGKEQRIIVTGDADFISNIEVMAIHGNKFMANFYFSKSLFSWLSYGEFPIYTILPEGKDKKINITPKGLEVEKIFLLWVLPGLLLALGAAILIIRKRR